MEYTIRIKKKSRWDTGTENVGALSGNLNGIAISSGKIVSLQSNKELRSYRRRHRVA
jgi:hypothetical protein